MMSIYLCGVLNAYGHTRGNGCFRNSDRAFRETVQEAGGDVGEKGDGMREGYYTTHLDIHLLPNY